MRLGLRAKTLLWLAVMVTVIIATTSFMLFRMEERALRQERTLRGTSLAQHTADTARDPLILGDELTLRTMAEGILDREPGVLYVLIERLAGKDSERHVYFACHRPGAEALQAHLQKLRLPKVGGSRTQILDLPGEAGVIDIAVPVAVRGDGIGVVRVGLSGEEIHRAVVRSAVNVTALAAGLLVVFLFVSFGLVALAVRPIEYLADKAREMGRGQLETAIEVRSRDEIGRLAEALRSMGHQILAHQAEMVQTKRLEREMEIAREIQEMMVPREFPQVAGYSLAAYFRPAQVIGGDFYDVFSLPDGRLACAIADVSGKSISGALVMSFARTLLRSEAMKGGTPREVLVNANEWIRKDLRPKMFVTLVYLTLDAPTGVVHIASAGHPPPIRYGTGVPVALRLKGMAVGIAGKEQMGKIMEESRVELGVGQGIFLYTDGVTEMINASREEFGEERCLKVLGEAAAVGAQVRIDRMARALDLFAAGTPQADDITMLALERTEVRPSGA